MNFAVPLVKAGGVFQRKLADGIDNTRGALDRLEVRLTNEGHGFLEPRFRLAASRTISRLSETSAVWSSRASAVVSGGHRRVLTRPSSGTFANSAIRERSSLTALKARTGL